MSDELTKKEQYDLGRKRKEENQGKTKRTRALKKWGVFGAVIIGGMAGGFLLLRQIDFSSPASETEEVLGTTGIHWHTHLSIKILGEEQEIPAGIGLGVVHNPIHTHETDGIIHLEFSGRVTASEVRLGRFFAIWGKTFNKDCILDKCNGEEGRVAMFVNGQESLEFDDYAMQDGDQIEIVFDR